MIGLLCAGSTRYHQQGGRSSGKDKLSRSELAGLLSGLNRIEMNFALAKYGCDLDAERMLIAQVRVWSAGVAVRESWKIIKGRPSLSNMSALVVFEVVRPNRCNRCHGRSVHINHTCDRCSGSGYHHLSGCQIAEAIGVDHANYIRTWKSRYEYALKYVQDIDCEVNSKLRTVESKSIKTMPSKKEFATAPNCEYIFP
jgi:hypothetical protein